MRILFYLLQLILLFPGLGKSDRVDGGADVELLGPLAQGATGVEPAVVSLLSAVFGQRQDPAGDQEELMI